MLPTSTVSATIGAEPAPPPDRNGSGDRDSEDFRSQVEAQVFFDADPSDPDGLDGPRGPDNDDGIACEDLA